MYILVLSLHNVTRWFVLIFGLIAVGRAFWGLAGKKDWQKADTMAGQMFGGMIDLQVLLGLVLYIFFSPFTKILINNFGTAMQNGATRFFGLEHILMMIIALVLAHIGSVAVKKAASGSFKFKRAAIWYTITLLIILAMIPWPFMSYGRPLLRLFGLTI
jgi:hypothetical protein